jgi:hypothetical protein
MFNVGDKVKITADISLIDANATILKVPEFIGSGKTFPYKVIVEVWVILDEIK